MDETTLIRTVTDQLNSQLSVPVRTTGFEEEWPVPAIILDDWETTDITHHNTPLVQEERRDFNGDGTEDTARWFRFHYETRIDLVIRHSSTEQASMLSDRVKRIIREWKLNPESLHEDVRTVTPNRSANPRHQFREPTETELHASATIATFDEVVKDDYNTIEQITEEFTVN